MQARQILENYLLTHPNFWEFDNEMEEVSRLKAACEKENLKNNCNSASQEVNN